MTVCVIGAGPCGLAAGIALGAAGFETVILDRSCVVSTIADYPSYATFFSTAPKITIGGLPFPLAAEKPTRRDALAYYRTAVAHFGLTVRQYEDVERVERAGDGFTVVSRPYGGAARHTPASAIVMATGYGGSPNRLGVPGEDLPHVTHFHREGHEAFQRRAVVVGGGNSAAEAALDLYRCGAHVTLVHFGPTFDRQIKPWVRPDIDNRLSEGAIVARWDSRVARIEPGRVHLTTAHGAAVVEADHVYLMTGYTPNTALFAGLGVPVDAMSGIPAHDAGTMETPVPGVFVAGVVTAWFDANKVFIENGREHGARIASALRSRAGPRA